MGQFSVEKPGLPGSVLSGNQQKADFRTDPHFGFAVPKEVPGVEPHLSGDDEVGRGNGLARQARISVVAVESSPI
jgi:hypothetical protein